MRTNQSAEGLSALLADLAEEWNLAAIDEPLGEAGSTLVVRAVRRGGARCVVKVTTPGDSLIREASALAHWDGHGAVQLIAADTARGALLLERAEPGTPLGAECVRDDAGATFAAAEVIELLRSVGTSPPRVLPTLTSWLELLDSPLVRAAPARLAAACRDASALAAEVLADGSAQVVLHGDLHQGNILRSTRRPWLAADPKGVVGPREAEAAALLRNPRELLLGHGDRVGLTRRRVAVLSDRLGDDRWLVAAWGFVLAVLAAAWAIEDGGGKDEVERWLACADGLRAVARAAR